MNEKFTLSEDREIIELDTFEEDAKFTWSSSWLFNLFSPGFDSKYIRLPRWMLLTENGKNTPGCHSWPKIHPIYESQISEKDRLATMSNQTAKNMIVRSTFKYYQNLSKYNMSGKNYVLLIVYFTLMVSKRPVFLLNFSMAFLMTSHSQFMDIIYNGKNILTCPRATWFLSFCSLCFSK